ncbi:hypothetical protein CBR_g45205 [Chara braunii]|uniref:Uncharacterized protein n=1 Tax=Chara braunii TaxID=69332 RepID=A0A388K3C7_CHABU|nr:hypothetical protein CBR_g45205 [Chara braunii]|eukprot:GBG64509.1 hypothetical protein CBR_g45205 [Chara braunii]
MSDFAKTAMPRGGRGIRPLWRPLRASGGYERYRSHHRESTPVYDDGDIELFLDEFWGYADHMGWTMTQAIGRLRGVDKFAEPIAQIRREARTRSEVEARMQELRPSPVGPDGRPIHLEIGNAEEFIPAFEQFMHNQGILRDEWPRTLPLWTRKAERPLARQIRDMARDWEGCRAHLREAFRRPEPPQPRVERRLRSGRQRGPEPTEARPSRRGRKALARREEEMVPGTEGRGTYLECGLGPVEFHRFTEGGQRVSPLHIWEEVPVSGEPLQKLEAQLDVSQWRMPPTSERRDEPAEEVPQEEVQSPEREKGPNIEKGRAEETVIEVEEDTPPQTPAVGLRIGNSPESAPSREEESQREEVPPPLPEMLATHALEHPDLEEPVPVESPQEPYKAGREVEAEIPERDDRRTRERVPAGETVEEKRARVGRRWEEIQQERQRLEEAGALPDPPPPHKPYGLKEMWEEFLVQHGESLTASDKAEVENSQKADEYLDRRIRSLSKTSFDRYMMLEADLRGKEMRETSHGMRLEAVEAEVRELRALVASQAAIIQDLRQQLRGSMDGAESSRQGDQRQPGRGLPEQPPATEPRQEAPMGRVILEPEEAKAVRKAEREAFEFRTPTELAILPTVTAGPTIPPSVEEGLPTASGEPVQGSTERSIDVLLETVHTMQEGASLYSPEPRIEEPPEGEMGVAMEDVIESKEYRPDEIGIRLGTSTQDLETGSEEPMDAPQSYELSREASEAPSSPGSQRRKKRPRKSFDSTCFFCKKGEHRALQCLKFLRDLAEGKVMESGGRMYDRQGRIVERSAYGGRAQLYRQNQEEMSE